MKVLFMGSGDFALPILQKIHNCHSICAIYTANFYQEASRKVAINVVESFALQNNIFLKKEPKISAQVILDIKEYDPDVIVVASYGFILPLALLEIGKIYKPINVHPSKLPKWRGAAPIERSLEAGDTETAVCIIKMSQKMDAGDILLQHNLISNDNVTSSELRKITAEIGGDLVLQYIANPTEGLKQNETEMTHAAKIRKEELLLDFNQKVLTLYNKIRAFDSCGGCFFMYKNERIKIWKSNYQICQTEKIGLDIEKGFIYCVDGILNPIFMQREGKKIMSATEVFRGMR